MKILVFVPYRYDSVPGQRFRIEQWARVLERGGVRFDFVPFQSPRLGRILHAPGHHAAKVREILVGAVRRLRFLARAEDHWDVVFLYRELAPFGPPVLERLLARRGIPFVYDFDDAIFLPNVSDVNRTFAALKWVSKTATICRLAHHVTVGNAYLSEYARRHARQVSVVPTTIDTEVYPVKPSVEVRDIPVIGWSGSVSTAKHLRTVGNALRRLAERVKFRLKVVGDEGVMLRGVDVESKRWHAEAEVGDLRAFDIGIMPLPDDDWSRGKCGLKALQYMAVGVPTVASPVGVNREIIEDGHNGFLARGEDDWVDKLLWLLGDEALRARFAKEGRRTVEERYSARVQAPRVLEILERASARVHV